MTMNRNASANEEFFTENFVAEEAESMYLNKPVSAFRHSHSRWGAWEYISLHKP